MNYKKIFTREFLLEEYIHKRKTLREIAAEINCDKDTVSRYLRKRGIALRAPIRRSKMTIQSPDEIISYIPQYILPTIVREPIEIKPEKENINLIISDSHVGQKLSGENDDSAEDYFLDAFHTLTINTLKVIDKINCDWQQINVFILGDMVEGEGIYPSQAYEVFPLMKQLDVTETGISCLLTALSTAYDIPVNVFCVRGNHGRVGRFNSEETNWDTILYKLLQRTFNTQNHPNINIVRTDFWADICENQWGHKFFYAHGDNITSFQNLPHYGIDKAVGHWNTIFKGFDVFLMGHLHVTTDYNVNGIKAYVNGCMRFSSFPVSKLKRDPVRRYWLFGSCENRPVTWRYEIDVEPPYSSDPLESVMVSKLK